ncbi:MAG: 16S rRNA (cytosine(967)-C(5))-methyltransferase RsmB [Ruminococcaceae bacterium]|nr:16S rRNA (cytosine(967)-C(5))-methyltransferase RsmB [Oscillospiraceae bacterium]
MPQPRNEAVRLLMKIEKDASYSALAVSDALKKLNFSDSRDTAFTVNLVYGVLEHKITIDYNIERYLISGISKLKSNVLNILRVGAFQILYLDKIPVSAAVNEAVKCAKKSGAAYASGLVNAVLRKIAAAGLVLPDKNDLCNYLSVRYSVNADIVRTIISDYPEKDPDEIFSVFSGRRPIYIRCNTLRCTCEELVSELAKEGVTVGYTQLENCLVVDHTGDIAALEAYKKGLFHVQDMSSQLCCQLMDIKKGDTVLDCCAAPGGKSFTMAQYLGNTGKLFSCDIYEHKTKLIEKGAARLGINNLTAVCRDARFLRDSSIKADKVLCDVPCSGFGVMGRKPEIRYKSISELEDLPELQREILYSCSQNVSSGGTLIYSTCTLNKNENDAVCNEFLKDHPEFFIAADVKYKNFTDKYVTLFPDYNAGDGFFIAKFIKR